MSTSRLEKFIYAICSMEVSDLPAPLSRIEILWNCLITGETPDFEPQSRNEQYLMAMLGLYELENLPTPMSRGEKLLYKIAMGETDLSDVPGYLSRYEELLKYLIENGGVGDFEYILQTLNQRLNTLYSTKERPVKSAILKGNTLVNIVDNNSWSSLDNLLFVQNISIKKGQIYTVIGKIESDDIVDTSLATPVLRIRESNESGEGLFFIESNDTVIKQTFINNKSDTIHVRFYNQATNYKKLMIIEGDYTNADISYFEGMQSVKMPVLTTTGKNLFSENKCILYSTTYGYLNLPNNTYTITLIDKDTSVSISDIKLGITSERGEETSGAWWMLAYNTIYTKKYTKNGYVSFYPNNEKTLDILNKRFYIQIEQGTVATTYEPYKTNILTVNQDVELRGIGDVQDELDCLTGEVTERIGEIVLDGSENWKEYSTNSVNTYCGVIRNDVITDYKGTVYLNNKLNKSDDSDIDIEGIRINSSKRIFVRLNRDKGITDLTTFKQYLSQNPITIQYEMVAESIKTVDLTTVDQDGQPTKLKTYNDISHVELSSEGLIPEVELEVATKINETPLTMSPQHHDISNTQNELGQTIDEQTENTNATMMAMTEIYENL